jgi:NADH-ubiquinone oxidoreductase chain 5
MFLTVCSVSWFAFKIGYGQKLYFLTFGTWIYSDSLSIDWGVYYDNLTLSMLLVVTIVSALVHLYSMDYMLHDPHLPRFMSYLSLFTFFMFLLVVGNNFIILFLGWEGVGLCSYLLISFWYTRIQANKAAIKALIVNRIADLALTIGMVSIFFIFKSLDFHVIFSLAPFLTNVDFYFFTYQVTALTFICFLLFVGAMGKSAQIGLHTWLPDAMEGPTPVSALIHAATMVTAGVFLIIKCSPLFEYVPNVLSFITFIGGTTAFFSATVGLFQNDIKKVIAYSTCSQLGYMIFACGLSNYHAGLFHLINHAFFKALLFLSAGAIIHSLSNEQDIRKFGNLISLLPFTSTMFLIGTLSLIGLPFLTGFYSKDLILELALTKYSLEGSFVYSLGIITAFLTSFYSFRLFYMTFLYQNNSFRQIINHVHELPLKMGIALAILSLGSIFFGYFAKDLLIGLGTNFWNESIFILPKHNNQLEAEFFGLLNSSFFEMQSFYNSTYYLRWVKLLPFFFGLIAILLVRQVFLTWSPYHFDSFVNFYAPFFVKLCPYHPWLFYHSKTFLVLSNNIPSYSILSFKTLLKKKSNDLLTIKRNTLYLKTHVEIDEPYVLFFNTLEKIPLYYQYFIAKINSLAFKEELWNVDIKPYFRKEKLRYWYKFLTAKWYFDLIYNELLNRLLLKFAYNITFSLLDKGLLEIFGPTGLSFISFRVAFELKKLQIGRVYYYSYFMIMFLFLSLLSWSYLF